MGHEELAESIIAVLREQGYETDCEFVDNYAHTGLSPAVDDRFRHSFAAYEYRSFPLFGRRTHGHVVIPYNGGPVRVEILRGDSAEAMRELGRALEARLGGTVRVKEYVYGEE